VESAKLAKDANRGRSDDGARPTRPRPLHAWLALGKRTFDSVLVMSSHVVVETIRGIGFAKGQEHLLGAHLHVDVVRERLPRRARTYAAER